MHPRGFRLSSRPDRWRLVTSSSMGGRPSAERGSFSRKRLLLHVLSPTDACRDRLASFLFWNDFRGLKQALDVCQAQRRKVDLDVVRSWCLREHQAEKFQLFKQRLD